MVDQAVAEGLEAAQAGIAAQIERWLSGNGQLDFTGLQLTALAFESSDQSIGVRGAAQGRASVVLK